MPNDFSFPKARRLTRSTEFDQVRREGRVWRGTAIKLSVTTAPPGTGARVGIVTSRKVGGAVVRNRVRRRLREIVRRQQHRISNGTWLVIIASVHAAHASYRALEDEWLRLAKRASILAP